LSQLLSKVTVTSCSFYIKCLISVSALLLDDALNCWRRHWPMARSM